MLCFKKAPVATSAALVAALCLIAAPASAAETNTRPLEVERTGTLTDLSAIAIAPSISASADSHVAFERPAVTSIAAAVADPSAATVAQASHEAPEAAPAAPAPAPAPAPAAAPAAKRAAAPAAPARAAAPAPAPAAAPAPAPAPSAASGKGAIIAAAALAQLGVAQDCTALVEKSLQAAGVNAPVGKFSPAQLTQFGTPTSSPQPGDIVYYANGGMGMAHVAIYIGNGMAVHGGWNGGTTAIFSVNVGTGHSFFRVG